MKKNGKIIGIVGIIIISGAVIMLLTKYVKSTKTGSQTSTTDERPGILSGIFGEGFLSEVHLFG